MANPKHGYTKDEECNSVASYVEKVIDIFREWHDGKKLMREIWFRGHQNDDWKLLPTYYREDKVNPLCKENGAEEKELIKEFRGASCPLIGNRPTSDWEWYFTMQHYGIPTRLLDWTENALAALFFAVGDIKEKGSNSSVVWVLDACNMNKELNHIDAVLYPGKENHNISDAWSPDVFSNGDTFYPQNPLAIWPQNWSTALPPNMEPLQCLALTVPLLKSVAKRANSPCGCAASS